MAKSKTKSRKVAGLRVPRPVAKAISRFLDSDLGREVAAAALGAAAHTLLTRHPRAALAGAGSGVAGAAKTVAGHAVEGVAHLLHGASDRLRDGMAGDIRSEDNDGDEDAARAARLRRQAEGDVIVKRKGKAKGRKNRAMSVEQALFADVSPKQIRKMMKAARAH